MCDAHSALMNEVRQVLIPTSEESAALVDRGEVDELVRRNMPLVVRIASKFSHNDEERMDLIQVGSIGLWKAAEGFDSSRGFNFSTFAYRVIKNEILRELRPRKTRVAMSYIEPWSPKLENEYEESLSEAEQDAHEAERKKRDAMERESLSSAVCDLNEKDQIVIRRRFAIGGGKRCTLKALSEELGVSGERIRQRQERSIRRLRKRLAGLD